MTLPHWREVALKRVFKILDEDGDGFISHEELAEAASAVGPQDQYARAQRWTPLQTKRAMLFLGGGVDRVSLDAFLAFYGKVMGQVKDDHFEVPFSAAFQRGVYRWPFVWRRLKSQFSGFMIQPRSPFPRPVWTASRWQYWKKTRRTTIAEPWTPTPASPRGAG